MDDAAASRAAELPLAGVRVVDLTLARAGPTCVRHLADWGADVVAVQAPDGGEAILARDGFDYQNLHRGKRVVSLDLKSTAGREAFLKLVGRADVLVENMRPPVKHRLKIAYDDLKLINPGIVYGSISGFGQDGPYAGRAGVDQIAQGMGGLMSITGEAGRGPMRAGIAVSDVTAGTLLALAIMMALYQRQRTGEGRYVHTSLLESQVFLLDFQAARWLMAGEVAGQSGNDHPTLAPMGVFPTADGQVNIAASAPAQFARFCKAAGRADWATDPRWSSGRRRTANRAALNAAIAEATALRPSAWWIETLNGAGVPCGPILAIDEVFADPQVAHLGLAQGVDHPRLGPTRMVASPLNLAGLDKQIRSVAPLTPEHTDAVLAELGYEAAEIEAMRRAGAI
ncbi:MAG TPA: CaiB/BaiF CoA-transferase family protein [Caulobacteraceae bacterium]|nr:CaiB/BaiF CoA-transferase family protein [Caulobacteraceae bacterium]